MQVANLKSLSTSTSGQLRFIQGLRGLAVVLVVAFHMGLPVPGGFIGVDVFFVISGYVITLALIRRMRDANRISIASFYLGRFRRLAPALAVMVIFTTMASAALFSPLAGAETTGQTGLAAVLGLANVVIARVSGGYFDPAAEANPLLHTWSLSVEEQFYVIFPILLLLAYSLTRLFKFPQSSFKKISLTLIGLLTAVSFWITVDPPTWLSNVSNWYLQPVLTGFFSPLSRAWEFLVGAILALSLGYWQNRIWLRNNAIGFIGLAGVIGGAFIITKDVVWPGFLTLLPVIGTCLVIISGTLGGRISTLLSHEFAVWTGDRSYSIYLWHWPFIVFAVALFGGGVWVCLGAVAVSMLPSILSYKYIENTLRDNSTRKRLKYLLSIVLVLTGIGTSAYLILSSATAKERTGFSNTDDFFAEMQNSYFPCTTGALDINLQSYKGIARCFQSKSSGPFDLILFGDSHAEQLFTGLSELNPTLNVVYLLDTPPYLDGGLSPQLQFALNNSAAAAPVVYTARWVGLSTNEPAIAEVLDNTRATISALIQTERPVIVVGENPSFSFRAEDCAAPGNMASARCTEDLNPLNELFLLDLKTNFSDNQKVSFVAVSDTFCTNGECEMNPSSALLYRDDNHLNLHGSKVIAQLIGNSVSISP